MRSAGLGHNQINFFDGELHNWSNYETGTENKLYNYSCFKCHTTGGTQEGTWLEAVPGLGNFSEGGVGCEAVTDLEAFTLMIHQMTILT